MLILFCGCERHGYYRDSVASSYQPASVAGSSGRRQQGSLYQFFGPGGVLSRTHPGYEFRRGQLQMAEAIEQALQEKRHLIIEAGTGTGKTLAYLVPVIRSGKRVIISTGTKNLQEQLFYKDIPFLEKALFADGEGKLSVCYMKGRNNYLCRKKLYDRQEARRIGSLPHLLKRQRQELGTLVQAAPRSDSRSARVSVVVRTARQHLGPGLARCAC